MLALIHVNASHRYLPSDPYFKKRLKQMPGSTGVRAKTE
jgi:hypothetical protein